ncbi:MAG: glycosyltransferase family 2 protein [bacterium]|nr:glycosyltransferase family 2 protein [bacterium]
MRQTITAVIPALNEEKNITRCIESIKWCDKVIVMWMGRDKTGEIAEKLGAEVIKMNSASKDDFASVQKNINWAIDHCDTDWMLRIDADEAVTDELHKEIQNVIHRNNQLPITNYQKISNLKLKIENSPQSGVVAYGIPRSQYFCGGFLKGGDWAYDRLIRLFKPKFCRYDPIVNVHEQFKVNGKIDYMKNRLLHYSHPTFKDVVEKFQKYTDIQIVDITDNYAIATLKMFILPVYIFLRWMIWHHGYRDGLRGIVAGLMRGWYEFLLYKKYLAKA